MKKPDFFVTLRESAVEVINDSIEVVEYLDLMYSDYDLNGLINFFKKYQDFEFTHKQRLVILHHDLDYYPSWDSVGNTIFNIIQIVAEFDISTDHIVILNSNFGGKYADDVNYLCEIENLNPIQVVDTSLWYDYPPMRKIRNIDITPNKKNLFCFLNGVGRSNRKTMYAWLAEYNLLEQGNISWHADNYGYDDTLLSKNQSNTEFSRHLRTTYPCFSRINESMGLSKLEKQLHMKHHALFNKDIKSSGIVGTPNDKETRWTADFLQESLVYLVSETVGDYPHILITEKTFKAFASKVPFMIAGPKNILEYLRSKGFKTFNNIWDESYDNISDFYNRSKAIAEQLNWLKDQDQNKILNDCIPILEYNYNHLRQFHDNELSLLSSNLCYK